MDEKVQRDLAASKRWTINAECGYVLARFNTAEEAWAALCSDVFLSLVSERYEEETDCAAIGFLYPL